MMFQLPPVKINLPKPKYKNQEIKTDDGRRARCQKRDTYLDMSQMGLNNFPKTIVKCEDLDTLILNRNFLRDIPHNIVKLEYLETLDLSFNRITEIPIEIFSLTELRELNMSNNTISEIPLDIRYLKYLKILNLSNNRIKRLPNNMQNLRSLVCLNVSFNKIEVFQETLCSCFTELQILNCSYNLITMLPYEIIFLSELLRKCNAVNFSHNPITWPSMDIVLRGLDALRDYIEPKWRDLREFKQRKITRDTYMSQATNLNAANLWDRPPSITPSKAGSVISKKPKPVPEIPQNNNTAPPSPSKSDISKTKSDSKPKKSVRTTKKVKKTKKSGKVNGSSSPNENLDQDNSSRVTLVEVYGDSRSTIGVLSPVADTKSPMKETSQRDADSAFSDGRESELMDIINNSLEPPDLDIPDVMNSNQYSGGGMLEQWLGAVQSLTVTPTSRGRHTSHSSNSLDNLELPKSDLENSSEHINAFTPFSDVVITKSVKEESISEHVSEPQDEISIELDNQSRNSIDQNPTNDVEDFLLRHSISSPETITKSNDLMRRHKETILKKTSFASRSSRRPSGASSVLSDITITSNTKKKKKRKKKKKKQKQETLSEMELYSRIPFKPLFISPRTAPCSRGLRTWCYFTEPKSCYLIDNMTEVSSTKHVTFGTDEVTMLSSTPSTSSLLSESCIVNNSVDSLGGSVHSLDTHNSQQLSLSRSTPGSSLAFSQLLDDVSVSDMSTIGALLNTSSKKFIHSIANRRPSSLPAPKEHTWTSDELQKYIYKPSDLIIPPKILISYLGDENEQVHRNQILKLVNTLEMYGFAECICDITNTQDIATYDLKERGYVQWLDEKIQESEFVLIVLSSQYIQNLACLTKLDSYSTLPLRTSPYITPADLKRWGIGHHEVNRKFVPIFNDDSGQMTVPNWLHVPPFFVPSELCELGYHLVSRDSRESVMIPNLFDRDEYREDEHECKEDIISSTDIGSKVALLDTDSTLHLQVDVFRVLPVTAHLTVAPLDIPPDWRVEEIAGKIRYYWIKFARTCGIDSTIISEIDSVYSGMLAKSVQCLKTWKIQLVGRANYEELSRRLHQIDQKHVAEAYCYFENN